MTVKEKKYFILTGTVSSIISACLGLETYRENHLGFALLFSGVSFCSIGALTLGSLFILKREQQKRHGRILLWPAYGVILLSLITPLEYLYIEPVLLRNDHFQDVGMVLFSGALCFYLMYLNSKGTIKKTDKRKQYRNAQTAVRIIDWLCHPLFACLMLLALGLSIGYSSLIGVLISIFLILPGLVCYMLVKEKETGLVANNYFK